MIDNKKLIDNVVHYVFQNSDRNQVRGVPSRGASPTATAQTIVRGFTSRWHDALGPRLEELMRLPFGWDGYGAGPVSWDCASFAAFIVDKLSRDDLSPPSLIPGSDGTLQIEWHKNSFDIELEVLGPNRVIGLRYDSITHQETLLDLNNDFTEVKAWLNELTVRRLDVHVGAA